MYCLESFKGGYGGVGELVMRPQPRRILAAPLRALLRLRSRFSKARKEWRQRRMADYFIVSHPKAGRTWLRVLLAKIFSSHFNVPFHLDPLKMKMKYSSEIPGVLFTHAGAEIPRRVRSRRVKFKIPSYMRKRKVIFLARDPRDTIVSFYYQATKRVKAFHGSKSEFIRDERFGIDRLIEFMNLWGRYLRERSDSALMVTYEDMHRDLKGTLRKILDFMNLSGIDDRVLDEAMEFASFERMKEMERQGVFQTKILLPADPNDPDSYKVRKGKVGGYLEELSQEDVEYVNKALSKLDPLFPYRAS